jgi:hypothetical protein
MGEAATTTFTILLFIAAFLGSGAYAVLSIADFRAARRGFWATATSFAAIGVVLGLMTTWPLPARITIAAVFAAVAFGSLTWVLDYLRVRERLGIEATANQPDIILLPPTHTYKLTWSASSNLEMVILPSRRPEETEPLRTGLPTLQIKNIGSGIAKSVTIEWDAQSIDLKAVLHNSERLEKFTIKLSDTNFGIFSGVPDDSKVTGLMNTTDRGVTAGPNYKGYLGSYSQNVTTQFPYMAPEINNTSYQDAVLPLQIAHVLELYIVATMPEGQPNHYRFSLPPIFATVRWESPQNGKPSRYRIDVTAINLKPWATVNQKPVALSPDIEADVQFTVTPVGT